MIALSLSCLPPAIELGKQIEEQRCRLSISRHAPLQLLWSLRRRRCVRQLEPVGQRRLDWKVGERYVFDTPDLFPIEYTPPQIAVEPYTLVPRRVAVDRVRPRERPIPFLFLPFGRNGRRRCLSSCSPFRDDGIHRNAGRIGSTGLTKRLWQLVQGRRCRSKASAGGYGSSVGAGGGGIGGNEATTACWQHLTRRAGDGRGHLYHQ